MRSRTVQYFEGQILKALLNQNTNLPIMPIEFRSLDEEHNYDIAQIYVSQGITKQGQSTRIASNSLAA